MLVLAIAAAGCGGDKEQEAATPGGDTAAAADGHQVAEATAGGSHAADAAPSTGNPVRDEMIALREAYITLIDAVLHDKPETVEEAFHKVHELREKTEEALHAGQVRLPRNGDRLEEFVKLDEEFHASVEKAVEAARAKDRRALTREAQAMLDRCVTCHERYR